MARGKYKTYKRSSYNKKKLGANGNFHTPSATIKSFTTSRWIKGVVEIDVPMGTQFHLTIKKVRDVLALQVGYMPTSVKVHSLEVFNTWGVIATDQQHPEIVLHVRSFNSSGVIGEKHHQGTNIDPARIGYKWPWVEQQHNFTPVHIPQELATIEPAWGRVSICQVTLTYLARKYT